MTGAPYLRDLDDVRRNPTLDDLAMFHKLATCARDAFLGASHRRADGPPDQPPASADHLFLDETFRQDLHGHDHIPKNAEDVMEMCAILFGDDFMKTNPVTTGNCNGNSPLVWDETMLGAMRAFCRRNQPVLCSPFVLGGANTPASVRPRWRS
jgi:trimethylamine--corrinoid protein Co-methyltransferase